MYECCGRFYGLLTLFLLLGHSSSHIGKKCNFARICFVRHASCDNDNICRCNPDYPIQISDNKCAKDRRHLEYCTDTKECAMHDKNMYCSLTSSQSRCECHDGFIFDADRQECEPIEENRTSHDILLPMAVGVSVALSSMLCCFLALWRLCNRGSPRPKRILHHLTARQSPSKQRRSRKQKSDQPTSQMERGKGDKDSHQAVCKAVFRALRCPALWPKADYQAQTKKRTLSRCVRRNRKATPFSSGERRGWYVLAFSHV